MAIGAAENHVRRGLEGVLAAKTKISRIDRENCVLRYAGYDVSVLAAHGTYEDVCHLLWTRRLPNKAEREELAAELASYRDIPRPVLRMMTSLPRDAAAMTALRTAVSALGAFDPDADDHSPEAALRKSKRLVAQVGVLVAAWGRIKQGKEPLKPDPKLGHAADFLRRLHGRRQSPEAERLAEAVFVVCAEHGLNPSTFAARVTASTMTDVHGAVAAAIAAMQGPLSGGAAQAFLEMLLRAPDPDAIERDAAQALARKEKIPGFGHRAYQGKDPRAAVCESLAEKASERLGEAALLASARRLEAFVLRERKLHANVEAWGPVVFHLLRLSGDLFAAAFAASRVAGWTAHVLEQRADNRIFRPDAAYEGAADRTPPASFLKT